MTCKIVASFVSRMPSLVRQRRLAVRLLESEQNKSLLSYFRVGEELAGRFTIDCGALSLEHDAGANDHFWP